MTPEQASKIVSLIRDNWILQKWPDQRADLFAETILNLPYKLTARVVGERIKTGGKWDCPLPGEIRGEVLRAIERRQLLKQTLRDRLAIENAPPPEECRAIIRGVIEKLEAKLPRVRRVARDVDGPLDVDPAREQQRRELLRRQAMILQARGW